MKEQPQNQALGASETTRFFFIPGFRLRRVPQASYAQAKERSQIWPKEIRIPASAKTPIRELCTTLSPRALGRAW